MLLSFSSERQQSQYKIEGQQKTDLSHWYLLKDKPCASMLCHLESLPPSQAAENTTVIPTTLL